MTRDIRGRFEMSDVKKRFEEQFVPEPNTGCYVWAAKIGARGYGQFYLNGRTERAHRAAWKLYVGPIPDGMKVLHHCDFPPCVNWERCLFLGTLQDNAQDMIAKNRHAQLSKTHCPTGHPYAGDNVYLFLGKYRRCRTCDRNRRRLRRQTPVANWRKP